MKNKFIKKIINYVSKDKEYSQDELDIMKYALEGLYLTGTKIIVITLIAICLGISKEYFYFLLVYTPIRSVSFGWHANTTNQCWVISILSFIGIPLIFPNIQFNLISKVIIILLCLPIIFFCSPCDTKKKPIINKKRRYLFKAAATIISLLYAIYIIFYNNIFVNLMIASLIYQCILINPIIYKISGQSYNNYKTYNINKID